MRCSESGQSSSLGASQSVHEPAGPSDQQVHGHSEMHLGQQLLDLWLAGSALQPLDKRMVSASVADLPRKGLINLGCYSASVHQ